MDLEMYKIPLFDLNFGPEEEIAAVEAIRSGWISTGPKTTEFENLFSDMLSVNHSVATSNCTVALHLAMKIAGLGAGDEVICPSLTFVATVNAIRYVDANPVFADICGLDNLTIDPEDIKRKLTEKTKAIVVMHYGGFACKMNEINAIAKEHNLKVIEDACHGPLSEYYGKKLGTIGDIGCFSFFSNKNISTGEGGMLVTGNDKYYEQAKLLRSHGMTTLSYERSKGHSTAYDVIELGYNYRMDDIRSAIGIAQLKKVEEDLKQRALIRAHYVERMTDLNGLVVPFKGHKHFSSNYIFPIVLESSDFIKREKVRTKLSDFGIQTSVHYPAAHKFAIYKDFTTSLPKTEYVADNLITLPMYSRLTLDQVEFVVEKLRESLVDE